MRPLPNLIIIGAMKCATSSLHYYLGLHPEIWMSREKELYFFSSDERWQQGETWYRSHFHPAASVNGEASPAYTTFPGSSKSPERMHALIPDAKLIYLVRDPIDRIVSQHIHMVSIRPETPPLPELLTNISESRMVAMSRYYLQLSRYLAFFPLEQILVVQTEKLRDHREETMQNVFRFLGVDDTFRSDRFAVIKHSSRDKGKKNRIGLWLKQMAESRPARLFSTSFRMEIGRLMYRPFSDPMNVPEIENDLRQRLTEHLAPDAEKLRNLTGLEFREWSV